MIRIEKGAEKDVPLILKFIRALADYERLSDKVVATEERLQAALFGDRPAAEVLLAYDGGEPAGFAVYFQDFSTFLASPGIYLEDIFVEPERRGQGIGKALLIAVAKVAQERGGRMNWSVLKWNRPAIDFYRALGAVELEDWSGYRLSGEALKRLAESAR